jgi:hypothetical protein
VKKAEVKNDRVFQCLPITLASAYIQAERQSAVEKSANGHKLGEAMQGPTTYIGN